MTAPANPQPDTKATEAEPVGYLRWKFSGVRKVVSDILYVGMLFCFMMYIDSMVGEIDTIPQSIGSSIIICLAWDAVDYYHEVHNKLTRGIFTIKVMAAFVVSLVFNAGILMMPVSF